MFLAHFAVGFAAKRAAPRASLGTLFLGAQFIDLLWPTFLLLGIESARITPGIPQGIAFEHYPWSHSLLATLVWGALLGGVYFIVRRDRSTALVLGLLVPSHWLLDALVHRPDLPLAPGSASRVGLGLWDSLPLTLALEFGALALGVWLYLRTTRALDGAGRWALWSLLALLALIQLGNLFGAPPPNVAAIAWLGQAQWLLIAWGWWLDRHRVAR